MTKNLICKYRMLTFVIIFFFASSNANMLGCTFGNTSINDKQYVTAYISPIPISGKCQSQLRYCNNGYLTGSYQYRTCTKNTVSTCNFSGQILKSGQYVTAYENSSTTYPNKCKSQLRYCNNGTLTGNFQNRSCKSLISPSLNCQLNGQTILNNSTVDVFLVPEVPVGTSCLNIKTQRTCANGILSGDTDYRFLSCASTASALNAKTELNNFRKYIWSATWYPWFNNVIGNDNANKGLNLFRSEVVNIKNSGLNTVWLVFPWFELQNTSGNWNTSSLNALKLHLDELKAKNMKAIIPLNYIGPGWSPADISGCGWFNNPSQVDKFTKFTTDLFSQLYEYKDMTFYLVYTEQATSCFYQNGIPYAVKGYYYDQNGNGVSTSTLGLPNSLAHTYWQQDSAGLVNMLKNSVSKFTKDIPDEIRNQMYIGIHDAYYIQKVVNDLPLDSTSDFDFVSFAYYPTNIELEAFPNDASTSVKNSAGWNVGYLSILNKLDESLNNLNTKLQSINFVRPVMVAEFGWLKWDPVGGNPSPIQYYDLNNNIQTLQMTSTGARPTIAIDSPSRNLAYLAFIDWALTRNHTFGISDVGIGFNLWSWTGRYLDHYGISVNASSTPLNTANQSFVDWYHRGLELRVKQPNLNPFTNYSADDTTVIRVIKNKLLPGELPYWP